MGPKDFSYKGKTLEELKTLDTREFAKISTSRAKRSILRHFQKIEKFIARCQKKTEKGKQIKTHSRELIIVPKMVGYKIGIYNGKQFIQIEIVPEMLGHRLGEFAATRGQVKHGSAGVGATRSTAHASVK